MDFSESVLVPAYFIHAAGAAAISTAWFLKHREKEFRDFGLGLLGYTLGTIIWVMVVLVKPDDLKPLILIGAVPFLLGHVAFARAAFDRSTAGHRTIAMASVFIAVAVTFVTRAFIYPSQPFFSDKGLLFFGLDPLVSAMYISTVSISFLPATQLVAGKFDDAQRRLRMRIILTALYVNIVVLVSAANETLLLINGVVMSIALLALWTTLLPSLLKPTEAAPTATSA